jgi:hypothetical protein
MLLPRLLDDDETTESLLVLVLVLVALFLR